MANKIIFHLNSSCDLCKRGVGKLAKLQARNQNAYGSRNLTTGKMIGKLQLINQCASLSILSSHWGERNGLVTRKVLPSPAILFSGNKKQFC